LDCNRKEEEENVMKNKCESVMICRSYFWAILVSDSWSWLLQQTFHGEELGEKVSLRDLIR